MKISKCPVCNKEDTVEWLDEETRIFSVLGVDSIESLNENIVDILKTTTHLGGGSWICNYNKGGCGCESGWKTDKTQTSWLRRQQGKINE